MDESIRRCGFIGIVGRPNVGKSTLLNRFLGQKISITSPRAQTTRHRIVGILTDTQHQMIFVDTPGLHRSAKRAMNKRMNKIALTAMHDVDVLLWVLEAARWEAEDEWIVNRLGTGTIPVIAVLNKIDCLSDKAKLLPRMDQLAKKPNIIAVVPISAKRDTKFNTLKSEILKVLPESDQWLYPAEMVTDRTPDFIAAEIIREKLTRHLHEELPYSLNVVIERFLTRNDHLEIHAMIWVARESQKSIVIGEKGGRLKQIATEARLTIEKSLQKKVDLRCWVKAKVDWMNDENQLDSWGYERS